MDASLGFFARLWLALWLPWKLLFDAAAAARVERAAKGEALPAPAPPPVLGEPAKPAAPPPPDHAPALHLLAVLQREGRLVDFLQEDIAGLPDEQVGAGARVVHEGCRRALAQYLVVRPIRAEEEGSPVTLAPGFDPGQVRVTGNVVGQPPFRGRLAHRGWKAAEVKLPAPPAGQDASVLMPAEVEL